MQYEAEVSQRILAEEEEKAKKQLEKDQRQKQIHAEEAELNQRKILESERLRAERDAEELRLRQE